MLTRKQIKDDEAEIEAEHEAENGSFEERFEKYCAMTDAELAADDVKLELELDRSMAREREFLSKLSVPQRYAFERHECLRRILKARMRLDRLRASAVGSFDFVMNIHVSALRSAQARLLDLRHYRRTGIMPTGVKQ